MRITKALLHKFAHETIKQRKRSEPDLHAAYLKGSLLDDEPLLGGTTDIDLVLVHKYLAPIPRETTALTSEISADILHTTLADYEPPRQFRQNALMGYPLTSSNIILFDSDHWLEFLQSSVTAEFHRTDNVLARVNTLLRSGREIWRNLFEQVPENYLTWLDQFLNSLEFGVNALAGLIGPPLTTRRFMLTLEQRMEELGTPDVYTFLCGVLGCSEEVKIKYQTWFNAFEEDLAHLANTAVAPPHLATCRHSYYIRGIQALWSTENPNLFVWPLLRTWLDIHLALAQPAPKFEIWHDFIKTLGFSEAVSEGKIKALDALLDRIEVLIETWSDTYGI